MLRAQPTLLALCSRTCTLLAGTANSGRARLYAGSAGSSSTVIEATSDEDFNKQLRDLADAGALAVVDFTAKWCGPCRAIAPIFEKLSQRYPDVKFIKVDIDKPEVSQTVNNHMITGVPTFLFYRGAKRVEAFSGARAELLEELLKKHTAPPAR